MAVSNGGNEEAPAGEPGREPAGRRFLRWLASRLGAILIVVSLPLGLIIAGGALSKDGIVAAIFVLILFAIPVALGMWLARVGSPGIWRRPVTLRDAWRFPGTAGVAIGLMSIVLILTFPAAGFPIAFAALCLYPIVDAPRTVARSSWLGAALVSTLVWVVVFAAVTSTLESVRRLGEDSMIFLVPFMMYPLALGVAGLVRLEGRLHGRPRETSARISGLLGAAACTLLVGVPVTMNMIPAVLEKVTGTTPANTVYSADGEVVSAAEGRVDVRLGGARNESFHLTPGTRFGFLGPGWRSVEGPAGPAWLKPGQRVNVDYVYRGGEAQLDHVSIWVEAPAAVPR